MAGRRRKIDRLPPHIKKFIEDSIKCGIPCTRIKELLQIRYGIDSISDAAIRRYKAKIPPSELLPVSYVKTRLKGVDAMIDELQSLQDLAVVQQYRLGEALRMEESLGGMLMPNVEAAIREYKDTLIKLIELKQSLGLLPKEPERMEMSSFSLNVNLEGEIDEQLLAKARRMSDDELVQAIKEVNSYGRLL